MKLLDQIMNSIFWAGVVFVTGILLVGVVSAAMNAPRGVFIFAGIALWIVSMIWRAVKRL